jgi:hypothetical protein
MAVGKTDPAKNTPKQENRIFLRGLTTAKKVEATTTNGMAIRSFRKILIKKWTSGECPKRIPP